MKRDSPKLHGKPRGDSRFNRRKLALLNQNDRKFFAPTAQYSFLHTNVKSINNSFLGGYLSYSTHFHSAIVGPPSQELLISILWLLLRSVNF